MTSLAQLFRLRLRRHGAATISTVSTTTTLTLRPSEEQPLNRVTDIATAIATCPAGNDITVAVAGSVPCLMWPGWALASGSSVTFSPVQLLDQVGLVAQVGALANGDQGTVTLSWRVGAGNSGEINQKIYTLSVSDAVTTTYNIGGNAKQRNGGYPLDWLGAGTWSIQSQSTANAFEVFPSAGTNRVICWKASTSPGDASYGTAKAIVSPTIGAAAYTVTMVKAEDASTVVITFNVLDNTWNAGPIPSTMTLNSANCQLLLAMAQAIHSGDTILLNPGVYAEVASYVPSAGQARVVGAGAIPLPTAAYDAGFITIKPHRFMTANVQNYTISYNNVGAFCNRFTEIDFRTPTSVLGLKFTGSSSTLTAGTIQIDHNRGASFTSSTSNNATTPKGVAFFFVYDNYVDCGAPVTTTGAATAFGTGITIYARDSEIVGNWIFNCDKDAIRHAIYNSTPGSGKSRIAWNFICNKRRDDGPLHPDYLQAQIDSTTAPLLSELDGAIIEVAPFYGNIFVRGLGSTNLSDGTDAEDGQLEFTSDISGHLCVTAFVGNLLSGNLANGITVRVPATGCKIAYNTMLPSGWGVPSPQAGLASPKIRLEGLTGYPSYGKAFVKHNICHSVIEVGTVTAKVPYLVNNNLGSLQATMATLLATPAIGKTIRTPQEVIAAFTPLNDTLGASGLTQIGGMRSGVDYLRRTIVAELLALPPAPLGFVSIAGTPSVGLTQTATAPTFLPGSEPTSSSWQWWRNGVAVPGATASTWAITAGTTTFFVEMPCANDICTYPQGDLAVISSTVTVV